MIWSSKPVGSSNIPKIGYKALREEEDHHRLKSWHKAVWKFKYSLEDKIYMWLAIDQRVPSWDIMQKIS